MNTLRITILSASLLALVACGKGGSDPLQDRKVPTVDKKVQAGPQADLKSPFIVDISGPNTQNAATLTEGQPGSVPFTVRSTEVGKMRYDVQAVDIPPWARIERAGPDSSEFRIVGTPPRGVIPSGRASHGVQVLLQAVVIEPENPLYKGLVQSMDPIPLTVVRSNGVPTIKGVSGLKSGVREDQVVNFTIDVEEPAGNTVLPPEIQFSRAAESNSISETKYDVSQLVTAIAKGSQLSEVPGNKTVWRYTFALDPRGREYPYARNTKGETDVHAKELPAAMKVVATSTASGNKSEFTVFTKILFAPKKPVISLGTEEAVTEVFQGQTNRILVTAFAPNSRGDVSITKLSLPPGAYLEDKCKDAKPAMQSCQVIWYVSCESKSDGIYEIRMQATNTLNGLSEKEVVSHKYQLTRTENCGKDQRKQPVAPKKSTTEQKPATTLKSLKSEKSKVEVSVKKVAGDSGQNNSAF